jgi:hypothetical protein
LDDDGVEQLFIRHPKAVTCWDVADPLGVANTNWEVANCEKGKKYNALQSRKKSDEDGASRVSVVVIYEDGLALGHG